jgi:uncharacterized protein (DUF433 family)
VVTKQYVEQHERAYRITGTRVSLDSIAYAFRGGTSPETIQKSFPTLTLEQVYGAITFYLANEPEIDAYLRRGEEEIDQLREATRDADPAFYEKMKAARDRLSTKS